MMVIKEFFGEVLVSSLNPVNISEFQRLEQTTLNPLQPTAKQIPLETKGYGSNSSPKSGKKYCLRKGVFSPSPLQNGYSPLCCKGRLLGLDLSPANIVSESILNKFYQIHPLSPGS